MNFVFWLTIFLVGLVFFSIGRFFGKRIKEKELLFQRKDAIEKSRQVIGGQFSENLAPYFPNFPFKPTECKFLGRPIDFVVFNGLDEKNVKEIVFLEVKSGDSKLNFSERGIKKAIESGNVRFEEYRISKDLTGKGDED